jgi:pyrroloquinoline quinone biosynthesis protein E
MNAGLPAAKAAQAPRPAPPLGMLAELTHRCPLQCPYCANPLEMERASAELDTATWKRVLEQAAALGILQVHFSGGEPTVRRDLLALVAHARDMQLYSNLITSGVTLTADSLAAFRVAGLDHVQLSFQDSETEGGDRIGGLPGGHARKLVAAKLIRDAGFPLTANFVVHRQNLSRLPAMLALGEQLGAGRIEIAHVQYYGWGLLNRDTLMPSFEQINLADAVVAEARQQLRGRVVIDYVTPDYYAARPKACMGGWGRQFLNVTPSGRVLPCHAAESLTGLVFPSVRDTALADIWYSDPTFERYRGTAWMAEPCRSCERREIDWGGCRCQAFALTGDAGATDPACALSPNHAVMAAAVARPRSDSLTYRRIGGSTEPAE